MSNRNFVCDPKTGLCHPVGLNPSLPQEVKKESGKEIIYVGDPMCSWCWGISNHLSELKEHFSQFHFKVVVGGLRPGGGDAWNDDMKAFLRHHWEEVNKRSGQPFGEKLFELDHFNYDTEPACRSVVAARKWLGSYEFDFFEAVSRKFYVQNEDPKAIDFYQSICAQFAIPFDAFIAAFNSDEVKQQTYADFELNRNWGVRGYPTVLFRIDEKLYPIARGYDSFEGMQEGLERILKTG